MVVIHQGPEAPFGRLGNTPPRAKTETVNRAAESPMKDHEQAAASHGSGVQIAQRYLENAKAAATADEKVQHLTDALEAVLGPGLITSS